MGLMIALWLFLTLSPPAAQKVDFRNFTYPIPRGKFFVPGDLKWMTNEPSVNITLADGSYEFEKKAPPPPPSLTIDEVLYGYGPLTIGPQLDAVVVLDYETGGSAHWSYVYAFGLASPSPRLLGWLRTGAGGDSGLYRLFVNNAGFIIDVLDPNKRMGDCCSAGFIRTSYEWKDGKFSQAGPRRNGRVAEDPRPPKSVDSAESPNRLPVFLRGVPAAS